jgi:flavin-dependent dehydrogenase
VSAVPEHFDLVIVGAGPAGLVTAAMIAITTQKRVLVIDKGDDIERREAHEPRE